MSATKKLRICPLCEATCGLELETQGRQATSVHGDGNDTFSRGFLCPKGLALVDLDADPDRLRQPMIRNGSRWRKACWEEAFAEIDRQLSPIIARGDKEAVGLYLGNPIVHNTALTLYVPALRSALGTKNVFTASSVDQIPKQLVAALLFGNGMSIPIPDIDRCQYLIILGANPLVSNGSMLTAPNFGLRLKRLRQRGGRVVVIDPCRTKTARAADEHHSIRPGSDAYFLFGIVHTLFNENLTSIGRLEPYVAGFEQLRSLAKPFSPEVVSKRCGIEAHVIRNIARQLAVSASAAVYGRIGTCTQEFGTLASWLPEVIHVLTGNLDREGGAMFTSAVHGPANTKGTAGKGRGFRTGRWKSRVRGLPEIFGELPASCLSEEIETPGAGQIRALITVAGNPILSTPNSARLSRAFESLEYMLSLDIYLNETTRHANIILPGLSPLETSHYDVIFSQLAVRNLARYSPNPFEPPSDQLSEWETILRLVGIVSGMGSDCDLTAIDDRLLHWMIKRETKGAASAIHDRDPKEILAALNSRTGPERILDFMLRTGPEGEGFGANLGGLELSVLEENPHGIDLGPMKPRIPDMLRTSSGLIELTPDLIVKDVTRLQKALSETSEGMLLIGRRDIRSNNSWMHNLKPLATKDRSCTLQINPDDASQLGLEQGDRVTVTSRVGSVEIPVEITANISPGVVSIPHGWGHDAPQARLGVAASDPGVNSNHLADENALDVPSGNAVLCGIPVTIT